MNYTPFYLLVTLSLVFFGCQQNEPADSDPGFAPLAVDFREYGEKALFSGTDSATWDKNIRERGFILLEDGLYKMWYTGYNPDSSDLKFLGYATSEDGIRWERYANNPIYTDKWTEDVFVMKHEGVYYMFAEGTDDRAHLLKSPDGIHWESLGDLQIYTTHGEPIPAPYGTPTIFIKDDIWHLFYERVDSAIWVATSVDKLIWNNIQDAPVLSPGPEAYDKGAVAANQILEIDGRYYMYYHASSNPDWNTGGGGSPVLWSSNVAVSDDLIHWEKYSGNPLVENNESSPIIVGEGDSTRLYTMHDVVNLHLPKK